MNLTRYIYITLFFIVYTLPISILNKPYRDDYDRIIKNYLGWSDNGRPLSDIVIGSLVSGGPVISFGVFSCILASLIIALTCCMYGEYIRKSKSIKSLLPLVIFYSSPFFIQFLYYKLDSITILLSIAVLFVPFTIKEKHSGVFFNAFTIICVIISLSLYQAAFPVFLALLTVRAQYDDFTISKTIKSIIACFAGVLIYKFFIAGYFINGIYSEDSAKLLSPFNSGFIDAYMQNIFKVWGVVKLINSYSVAISLLIAAALIIYWLLRKSTKESSKAVKMTMTLSSVIVASLLFFLQERVTTEPRSMIYVSCFILSILALAEMITYNKLMSIICSVILICFANIYMHVNYAREEQFRYEQSVLRMVSNMSSSNPGKTFIIHGWAAPKRVLSVYEKTPLSIKIANPDFGSWYFNQYLEYYDIGKNIKKAPISDFKISCASKVINYNGFFTTEIKDNTVNIFMRNIKCN